MSIVENIDCEKTIDNSAVKAAFWFAVCNIIQRGIQFLYTPWYTRVLSPIGYGKYASFLTWGNIVAVFATLNLCNAVFANAMIEFKTNREKYLFSMYGLTFISSSLVLIVFYPLNIVFQKYTNLCNLELILLFFNIYFQMVVLLWGAYERFEFRYKNLVIVTISISVLNPLISFLLYYCFSLDYYAFLIGYTLPYVLMGVILVLFKFGKKVPFINLEYWKYAITLSIPLIPHYLSSYILNQSDRLMVRFYHGEYYAGIYTLSYQVSFAISIIYYGINNSMAPWTYRMLNESKEIKVRQIISKMIVPSIFMSIVVMLMSPEIISILGSSEYKESINIVPDLVVATYIMFMNILVLNVLFYNKWNKQVVVATTIGAISNLVLNAFLLPIYGYKVASITTVLGFALIFACNCLSIHRLNNNIYPIKKVWISIGMLFVVGRFIEYLNTRLIYSLYKVIILIIMTFIFLITHYEQIRDLYYDVLLKKKKKLGKYE